MHRDHKDRLGTDEANAHGMETLTRGLLALLALSAVFPGGVALAQSAEDMQACLVERVALAPGETTVSELRAECAQVLSERAALEGQQAFSGEAPKVAGEGTIAPLSKEPTATERRYGSELAVRDNPFAISPHKPNYILLAAYNTKTNTEPFEQEFNREVNYDDVESKFQLSLKFPLGVGLFDGRADLMAGYTLRAFWQVYNTEESQPFRDYNHEPEIWLAFLNDAEILGWRNISNQFGYVHQSNGRGGDFLSRSWDRLYANFVFDRQDQLLWIKPWVIIDDAEENPDIDDFLGYGEVGWSWTGSRHTVSAMLRNHIESSFSRGATELSWSFPIPNYKHLRGYVQGFNGYGENLMDYNKHNTSIGIGVSLTDWLN